MIDVDDSDAITTNEVFEMEGIMALLLLLLIPLII
jgi:hypothetical protein